VRYENKKILHAVASLTGQRLLAILTKSKGQLVSNPQALNQLIYQRHDTEHNDTQRNDT
jgi:hypothetical protein